MKMKVITPVMVKPLEETTAWISVPDSSFQRDFREWLLSRFPFLCNADSCDRVGDRYFWCSSPPSVTPTRSKEGPSDFAQQALDIALAEELYTGPQRENVDFHVVPGWDARPPLSSSHSGGSTPMSARAEAGVSDPITNGICSRKMMNCAQSPVSTWSPIEDDNSWSVLYNEDEDSTCCTRPGTTHVTQTAARAVESFNEQATFPGTSAPDRRMTFPFLKVFFYIVMVFGFLTLTTGVKRVHPSDLDGGLTDEMRNSADEEFVSGADRVPVDGFEPSADTTWAEDYAPVTGKRGHSREPKKTAKF